tara:strand:- start:4581 stop:4862 length:282 start_codon:yes stop_codon:yes gene_type:complete
LEILDNIDKMVVIYIKNPLNREEYISLIDRLDGPLDELIRWSDTEAPDKPEKLDAEFVIEQLINNPKIMQRPIIDNGSRASICRTQDKVLSFL